MSRVLVLGASSGLGAAVSSHLAEAGWTVTGVARRLAGECGPSQSQIQADLSDWQQVMALRDSVLADPPDLVVYCAAQYARTSPGSEPPEELETLFRVNALVPYVLLHPYLAAADARLRTCVVINSDAIYHASEQSGPYAASKAALRVLTTSLAQAARHGNAAAATLLLGPLADRRKLDQFERISEQRGVPVAEITGTFLKRSNPAYVIDTLIEYGPVVSCIRHIHALGRTANGMLCRLDGGSAGSLV